MQRFKTTAVFSVLNGLTVLLAGLFALELHFALKPFDYPPLPAARANVEKTESDKSWQSAVSGWGAVVLARPLFSPSRRPRAASPAPQVNLPRLSGIMIMPTEKIAVFSPAAGSPIILAENMRLGPFTILFITADSVTVKGPDGVIVLRSDGSQRGQSEKPTPGDTILPGGIDLSQIDVPLPSAATWNGPPAAN